MERKAFNIYYLIYFLILGFVSLRFSTHTYEVKLNVIEVPNSQSSSSKKNISSIAQIVGIGSNSQNVLSNFELYKKMFNSRVISEELFNDIEFMKKIFPGQRDENKKVWKIPAASNFVKFKLAIKISFRFA